MNEDFFRELVRDQSPKALIEDGQTYRARFRGGSGDRLIVLFHASMPAYSPNRPHFLPFFRLDVPQLSIADPTLEGHDDLSAGWYLGGAGQNVINTISRLVIDFSRFLGCHRRIYIGGSSGGFASLLYSSMDADSVAIAVCPQVDLDSYLNSHVIKLMDRCYGGYDPDTPIKQVTGVDLMTTYSGDFRNSAIVLVSPGDLTHLHGQLAPLLASINPKRRGQFIVDVTYYGIPKHSRSVPLVSCIPWIQAALISTTFTAPTILDNYHALTTGSDGEPGRSAPIRSGAASQPGDSSRDLQLASLVADHHRSQSSHP